MTASERDTLWYIRQGDTVVGPGTIAQLKESLRTGKIVASTSVATSPDGPWVEVQSIPALAPAPSVTPQSASDALPDVPDHAPRGTPGPIKLLIAIVALNVVATGFLAYRAATPPGMPRWEYQIEFYPDGDVARGINEMGRGGWEIVTERRATAGEDAQRNWGEAFVFRRRMLEDAPR